MKGIKLGEYNRLLVVRKADFGVYLDGFDNGDILLPARYVPAGLKIGDEIEVFVYLDQEERLVATTEHPLAKVGDFAYLEVAWTNKYGAFLKWGLMKDLFCPFREQKNRMVQGSHHIVHVHVDEESYRLMASAKVEKYLNHDMAPYRHNDSVDLLVWQRTELGFKVIVDNQYPGQIYTNQIYRDIHVGERTKGYVDVVREDGKIDVMLQPSGRQQTIDFADTLMDYLIAHGGRCPYGDKTDAGIIREVFGVSKKTLKRAIGDLYKRKVIVIEEEGIRLAKPL